MNEKQWKQIEEQLPAGAKILRWYTAAENGQIRVIAKAPADDYETRYNELRCRRQRQYQYILGGRGHVERRNPENSR